jgi:hypothetical protein
MNGVPDLVVTSVAFGQEQIQINYMEQKHQTPDASLDQTLVYTLTERDSRLVAEIQEALNEIIDSYWVSLRHPTPSPVEEPRQNRFLDGSEDD